MNNKEFVAELSAQNKTTSKTTTQLVNALVEIMATRLENESCVSVLGFGTFEVKKRLERILVNPQSKQRMLVPPNLTIRFKPNTTLKDKAK
ncbi:MAG: HU family DNA-binding protein [Bacteroidaceae bacterium]|nr:HU family DNA-binding protein [Bacteroidaceae bacterium]